jgi:hypothetical protein
MAGQGHTEQVGQRLQKFEHPQQAGIVERGQLRP